MSSNLPWRFDQQNGVIVDSQDKIVAFCAAARKTYQLKNANADFQLIVDAVNERERLTKAIDQIHHLCLMPDDADFVWLRDKVSAVCRASKGSK